MKYYKGMTFDVFVYKNYGFAVTEQQKKQASGHYYSLNFKP